ncbi:MAG: hypothetical protein V5A61_15185 [Haloarculaceae archaeon]
MSDDDDTYRFDPAEFREGDDGESGAEGVPDADGTDPSGRPATAPDEKPRGGDREFGLRGWLLVGMLFVALVLVPVLLYFIPRARWLTASLGLGYRDAFLVLPLVPALVLAVLAVWATTRP